MPSYKKKKRTSTIVVMLLLILVSILIVLVVYGLSSGFITFPNDETLPVSSSSSEESEVPPEPPVLSVTDVSGSGLASTVETLEGILNQHVWSVSVYYRDLSTGDEIEFNSLKKYSAGSVVKAPYCRWLISSGADLTEVLTLSEKDILEGSGNLQNEPIGSEHTLLELIEMAIVDSDNTAYKALTNRFGYDGYNSYAKNLGVSASLSQSNQFGLMSAAGAGILFQDIYSYALADDNGKILTDMMKRTAYSELISRAVDGEVAHKYGYNNGNAGFHDAAIVYGERPYILTIFSTLNPDKDKADEYIRSIASEIDKIHNR